MQSAFFSCVLFFVVVFFLALQTNLMRKPIESGEVFWKEEKGALNACRSPHPRAHTHTQRHNTHVSGSQLPAMWSAVAMQNEETKTRTKARGSVSAFFYLPVFFFVFFLFLFFYYYLLVCLFLFRFVMFCFVFVIDFFLCCNQSVTKGDAIGTVL